MCECRSDIEKRLVEHVKAQIPESAVDLSVSLNGYAFMLGEGSLEMKNVMPISIAYRAPTKGTKTKPSVMRDKKQTMNMTGNYCMFCGEKYEKDEPATAPVDNEDATNV